MLRFFNRQSRQRAPLQSPLQSLRSSRNGGFTLIEVVVSLFIFGVALTAILFLITTNLNDANFVKNSSIASGLAQEGLEITRNIRDRDWFLGNPFGASIPDGTYRVQWNSNSLMAAGSNPSLKLDSSNGIFSYDTGSDTIFGRLVTISTITASVQKRVVVTVSWPERRLTKTLIAEDHLFDWR